MGGAFYTESGIVAAEWPQPVQPPVAEIEGFEPTWLADRPIRSSKYSKVRAKQEEARAPEFRLTACPACRVPLQDPSASFCDACGKKLPRVGKRKAPEKTTPVRVCGDCGVKNPIDRSRCLSCAAPLGD